MSHAAPSCHAAAASVEERASRSCATLAAVLSVRAILAPAASRPPIVLVHGAANSASVWRFWQADLASRGWSSWALDLRGHGGSPAEDLAHTSMTDYAADVMALVRELARPPILIGWSMGGLAAMIAAARGLAAAYVGLAPSPPSRQRDGSIPLRAATFDAAEYGITTADVDDQPTMVDLDREERGIVLASLGLESRWAHDERKAGVVLTVLPCPALVVASRADATFPPAAYVDLSVPAERLVVDGASHWGLVLNRRLLGTLVPTVTAWLERTTTLR
jgi:pimeloyl-ACP methyl ester carboxylesterase